jgi:hypothetical protein
MYIIAFDEGYCALSTPIQSLPLEGKVGPKDPDEVMKMINKPHIKGDRKT